MYYPLGRFLNAWVLQENGITLAPYHRRGFRESDLAINPDSIRLRSGLKFGTA